MVGYQGWFRTPADGANAGWTHYLAYRNGVFSPVVDYWPDTSELIPEDRVDTPLLLPGGQPAKAFSSHNPRVVDLHFRWMRDYGIAGAFMQRFAGPLLSDAPGPRLRRQAMDDVLL